MALDIMDDQKVLVFREGSNVFEGFWGGERPEEYDGDFYLLADVEDADILVIAG